MSPRHRGGSSRSNTGAWRFRLLLFAYPRSFRRRYGASLLEAYHHERNARVGRSRAPMRFWTWILADTAHSALAERLGRWLPPPRPQRPDLPPTPHQSMIEMLHDFARDVRYGLRSLAHSPGFALTALLILSVGIGATAVVFTVTDSVFLTSPPHVQEPHRLVRLTRTNEDSVSNDLSYPDYAVFAERTETLAGLLAYDSSGVAATIDRADARLSARAWHVSANYFDVLGVRMALGRGFAAEEDDVIREGAVAVISEPFWRTSLGADPAVVGQTLRVNGAPLVVIGVAPVGFRGVNPVEEPPDLWVPVTMQPVLSGRPDDEFLIRKEDQVVTWLDVVGRLAPGATLQQAGAEVAAVNEYLVEDFHNWNEDQGAHLSRAFMFRPSQHDQLVRFTRLLGLVVGTVLLIVCANIAILQLARSSSRRHEIGVRAALGAGRARLVRQLLTESLLLSGGGVVGGYLIAYLGAGAVAALIPMGIAVAVTPDASVLGFAAVVGVVSAVFFGLAPAISVSRVDVTESLSGRGASEGHSYLRAALVVAQVAASLVLVTGAALFARSLWSAEAVDPGFAREGRVFMSANLSSHGYDDASGLVLLDEALTRIRALPGVEAASVAVLRPFRGAWSTSFNPLGDEGTEDDIVQVLMNIVGDDYFRTMDLQILDGRALEAGDMQGSDSVLVVNQTAAEILWPGERAVGQTLEFMADEVQDRIVGVVEDSNYRSLGEDPQPIVYAALRQYPSSRVVFAIAAPSDSGAIVPAVREAILGVDPDLALSGITTIEDAIDDQLGTYKLGAQAIGLFGVLGALLAAIGLYGVLSYSVAAQRREIGIRMALGDTGTRTIGRVVGRGLGVAAIGIALGLGVAFAAVRLIASMLFGVTAYDLVSFTAVPLLIVVITIVASWLPARRAATVPPAEALRAG